MIDKEGFRANVGVILTNSLGQLLWARRIGHDAWQFPQGGMIKGESPEESLYRELYEELGLTDKDVKLLGKTEDWLRYRLPERYIRHNTRPLCLGQKQKWFLLELLGDEKKICLERSDKPEFDRWEWVSYWYPLNQVVDFKREVYREAMKQLLVYLPKDATNA